MTPRAGYPMIYCIDDEFTARVYGKTAAQAIALMDAHWQERPHGPRPAEGATD